MQQRAPGLDSQALPSVVQKYIGICAKKPDEIKKARVADGCVTDVETQLRPALLALSPDVVKAVMPKLDGFMTMLILIKVVQELTQHCEAELQDKYGLNTGILSKELEEKFEARFDEGLAKKQKFTSDKIAGLCVEAETLCWKKTTKNNTSAITTEFKQLMKNYVFFLSASRVYRETDELQMMNITQIIFQLGVSLFKTQPKGTLLERVNKLRANSERAIQPYQGLIYGFDLVQLNPANAEKWREIAYITRGLYQRIYNAIPDKDKAPDGSVKQTNGSYPTVDEADASFKQYIGKTKYEMSLYNRGLADVIEKKLLALNAPSNVVQMSSLASAAGAAAAAASSSSSQAPAQIKMTEVSSAGFAQVIVTIPDELRNKDLMDRLRAAIEDVIHFDENKLRSNLQTILSPYVDADAKIRHLNTSLNYVGYRLANYQIQLLSFIPDSVEALFMAYCHRNYFFSSAHAVRATQVQAEIASSASPADWLKTLFAFRNELISQNSADLKHKVDEILLSAFNALLTPTPTLHCVPSLQ